jgi:UDP-N-acetylglucosamine transferase subunit ALG13
MPGPKGLTMRGKTPSQVYETEILDMPPGLERAVLRVIGYHIGKANAIEKPDLMAELNKLGFGKNVKHSTFERQIRRAIVSHRKSGLLICASSGDAGYYVAKDRQEYNEFREVELNAKIIDLSETMHAMDVGAKGTFGEGVQASLF